MWYDLILLAQDGIGTQVNAVFQQFIAVVRPNSIGDIFIYSIFLLGFITLLPMPDGNDPAQYLTFGVILMCILDLLRGDGTNFPIAGADDRGFFTFMIHVLMFVFAFITAGVVRRNTKQKAGATPALAVINGLIAVMYAIASFIAPEVIYSPIF